MENELLDLSNDFKNRIKEKNILLRKLKKIILICYGLIVTTDDRQDISLIPIIREVLSESLETYFNVESDVSDDED
tara:strand:- start:62 stop:289 length:228 start_codon:yes stop_codon:yes gene_type:complete